MASLMASLMLSSAVLIRGPPSRASVISVHLCTPYCSTVCLCLNNSLTHWVVVAPGMMMMMDAAVVLREHAF